MEYVVFATAMFLIIGVALVGGIAWASSSDSSDRDEEWVRSFQSRPAVIRVRSRHRP